MPMEKLDATTYRVLVDAERDVWAKVGVRAGDDPSEADLLAIVAGAEAAERAVTPAAIKAEASRRILAIAPEWRQRNALARALQLQERLNAGWPLTAEEQAEREALHALWAAVNAIRTRSDELEQTLPDDYTDDAQWP